MSGKHLNLQLLDDIILEALHENTTLIHEDLYEIFERESLNTTDLRLINAHLAKHGVSLTTRREILTDKRKSEFLPNDSLKMYLNSLQNYHILTKEEERELFIRLEDGDEEARNTIINSNLRLVVSVAKRYHESSLALMDLIQEGNIGLIKAIPKYDYRLEHRFTTYATFWIKQAIGGAIFENARTIKIPQSVIIALRKINKARTALYERYSREPSNEEISILLDSQMSSQEIDALLAFSIDPVSLDQSIDNRELHEFISDESSITPSDFANTESIETKISASFTKLNEKERRVILLRFGFYDGNFYSLEQIALMFGVTREAIRYTEKQAIKKIKLFFAQTNAKIF